MIDGPASVAEPTRERRHGTAASGAVWSRWVLVGWVAGVVVMLVRLVRIVASARRLTRAAEITDPQILQLVERLRRALDLVRPVQLIDGGRLYGPAVLGALRPALVLPMQLLTGLPSDMLEAILAHEAGACPSSRLLHQPVADGG